MEEIKELKELMTRNALSNEKVSRILDCSMMSLHRWLKYGTTPNRISANKIKQGLVKLRELYPEIEKHRPRFQILIALCSDSLKKMPEKEKDFWEEIISKMNDGETNAVFWAGKSREQMKEQILKVTKRLNISYPE